MNMMKSLQAERLIAKQYEERGYVVTLGPPPSRIPFPLGDHIPDILATKGSENILIEVKAPGARTDSDSYFRLDQQAQQHPGWQFMLWKNMSRRTATLTSV
jgi:Holliday junction resolvase